MARSDLIVVAAISLLCASTPARAETVAATAIATAGQPAAGVGGTFTSFQRPLINGSGDAAYIADYVANPGGPTSEGIWLAPAGMTPINVAHTGQDAPGSSSAFNLFQDLRLNDTGQVAFSASTGTDSTFSTGGIWNGTTAGPPTAIALRSAIPGARLSGFNNSGQATVIDTDTSGANTTVWFGRSTSDLAAAAPLGPTHVVGNVPLTAGGQVALAHNLVNSSDPEVTVGYEILAGPAVSPTTLIVRGPSEPVAVGSMNDAGQVAFSAASRVWIGTQGAGVVPVVGPASAVPGVTGAAFGATGLAAINHSGRLAFRADLSGPGLTPANNSGIFTGDNADNLRLVARTGDALPQAPGLVISTLGAPQVNAAGEILFAGTVTGTGGENDTAIFGYDPQSGLRLLVRSGDLLQIGPGLATQVLSVSLGTDDAVISGGEDGLGSNLNDAGRFVFLGTVTDGQTVTGGVFMASVPEPSAAPQCIALLSCVLLRRSHRPRSTRFHRRPPGL